MIRKYTTLLFLLIIMGQQSYSQTTIMTRVVQDSLFIPWEIIYGPDDHIWFTQKNGYICRLDPASGATDTLYRETATVVRGEGGMTGMALHPSFPVQPYVYAAHNYLQGSNYRIRIMRYTYNGSNALNSPVVLLDNITGSNNHNGCRLLPVGDKLFITTGDAENLGTPQDVSSKNGKVLRINLDGTIPADNPFTGNPVWSWGHRNPQGLVYASNLLFSSEHGPNNDDEINVIRKGRNYGWPNVQGYCDLPSETTFCTDSNVAQPINAWTPTLAVSGLDYYSQSMFPQFTGTLLMATLKDQHLYRLELNAAKDAVVSETIIPEVAFGRLRDICISPSGRIFLSTSNSAAAGNNGYTDKIIELYATTTGIPGTTTGNINVYPNPAWQRITVVLPDNSRGTYSITDISGRIISRGKIEAARTEIPVETLAPAAYFVQVTTAEGIKMTARFIKVK